MVDLFEEVEEELRSDRYLKLLRALAPWLTGIFALVLLGYLGYWGYAAYQDRNLSAAAVAYQNGVDALAKGDQATALTGFQAAVKAGAPGYKALALMQEGNLQAAADKPEDAAKLYDASADAAPNPIFGDLARLKAAEILIGVVPYAQIETRLSPLLADKRPYSMFAREALAMAKLAAGDAAGARRDFTVIGLSLEAPPDMRERSQEAVALIDAGEAPAAVQALKAAATMPPPPATIVAPPAAGGTPPAAAQGGVQTSPAGAAK